MRPFATHEGVAVPLRRTPVDTDQILPAVYMKRIVKVGYEDALFARLRQDSDFVLNQPAFAAGSVLFAGPDFGTGSSREHAVWALRDYGFRAVFSPRFGDIFRGNAGKQGLLCGVVTEDDLHAAWAAIERRPGTTAAVDLARRQVVLDQTVLPFEIDDYTRWRLMEGLDDIDLTLRQEAEITAFEARREAWRPTTLPPRS